MAGERMDDLVVFLPGIMGSVLEKNGRTLWNATRGTVLKTFLSGGDRLRELTLGLDDPQSEFAPDGVVAPSMIEDSVLVPGFYKVDGYTKTLEALEGSFALFPCGPDDAHTGNFVKFPYDWRRDIRLTAKRLKRVINDKLAGWRKETANPAARVILVAHSMGGLISQYYLEALEGWRDARALITFGTPYRGSVQALEYLAHGYKMMMMDFTAMLRSLPSSYQLLPRYKLISTGTTVKYVHEMTTELGLDQDRLKYLTEFHQAIDDAHERNKTIDDYRKAPYVTIPVVGTRQPTLNSAFWDGQSLTTSPELPSKIDRLYANGDGTVPRVSAIPITQSHAGDFRGYFVVEQHAALQKRQSVLDDLVDRLKLLQAAGLENVRSGVGTESGVALGLAIDDAFGPGEPIVARVHVHRNPEAATPSLVAVVTSVGTGAVTRQDLTEESADEFVATLPALGEGVYRVQIRGKQSSDNVLPVQTLFEVEGASNS